MTPCPEIEALIAAQMVGELAESDALLLRRHVARCTACAALVDTMAPRDTRTVVDHDALPDVAPEVYLLDREIARGGMGRIVVARDLRIGRQVAIKELLERTPHLAARFEREARVTARLQHPGIVPIYEVGRWPDGTPFYAMRVVEGRTMREAIRAAEGLEGRLALLPSVLAAAEAVAYAHSRQVIHRDLTPANVLVGAYGETVVIDWGLAKDLSRSASADGDVDVDVDAASPYRRGDGSLTVAGAVIGTPAYMPPEQARGEAVDARADVYALGALLYHLLAGQAPYQGSAEEIVAQVCRVAPPPVEKAAAGTPRDLASIVAKAMSRDPAQRYRDAGELTEELRRFQTGRLVSAHDYSSVERVRRLVRRNRGAVVASTLALAALTALGAVAITRVVRERDRARSERAIAEEQRAAAAEQRAAATAQNAAFMEEQGRQELLAGNTERALAWLDAAYQAGDETPALRFLLARALGALDTVERTLDCGGVVSSIDLDPTATYVIVTCGEDVRVWRADDGSPVVGVHADGASYSSASMSHDGRLLAASAYDGHIRVWDVTSGKLLDDFTEPTKRVSSAFFSEDGARLVTASFDGRIRIWGVSTRALEREFDASHGDLHGVRALPVGSERFLTWTVDGHVQLWALATGRRIRSIDHGSRTASAIAVSDDGSRLATGGEDGIARVWDLTNGRLLGTLSGHTERVWFCAFSPDGRRLITTSLDGTARIWDLASPRAIAVLPHGGIVWSGTFIGDGRRVVTRGFGDATSQIWQDTGARLAAVGTETPYASRPDVVVTGNRMFESAGEHVIVRRLPIDIETMAAPGGAKLVATNLDATRMIAITADGTIQVFDTATWISLPIPRLRSPMAVSHDGRRLAAQDLAGHVQVVDLTTGRAIATLPTASRPTDLDLDDGGEHLLANAIDSAPEVWDVAHATPVLTLDGHMSASCLNETGSRVMVPASVTQVEVWNVRERRVERTIDVDMGETRCVGHRLGRITLISAIQDGGGFGTWDVATGERLIEGTGDATATLDRTGSLLTTFMGTTVEVWETSTGRRRSMFAATGIGAPYQPVVTPDGDLIIGVSPLTSELGIWSARDGRLLARTKVVAKPMSLTEDSFQFGITMVEPTDDGMLALAFGRDLTLIRLERDQRSRDEIHDIVRARVPWRVVDGSLRRVVGTIRGRVVRDGAPVAGAIVVLQRHGDDWLELQTRTRADGTFRFDDVTPGHVGVSALEERLIGSESEIRPIDVNGDDVVSLARDLELVHEARVSGVVVDELDRPIPSVHVNARCCHVRVKSATTAADGTFTIVALTPDEYHLDVVTAAGTILETVDGARPVVTPRSDTDRINGVRVRVRSRR